MKRSMSTARRLITLALAGLLLVGLTSTVSAHETREVEGEFEFVVGFANEPAYVNQMNGLSLAITSLDGEEPVEGAEESLNAQVQFAGESQDLELRAVWGEPGSYIADVIPTSTGAYTFQVTGEIDGVEIDESFQGGPDTFSEVAATDELEFPETSSASAGASDQTAAFGIAGVVAGLLGLVAGVAAYYKVSNPGGNKNPAQQRREQKLVERTRQEQQTDEQA